MHQLRATSPLHSRMMSEFRTTVTNHSIFWQVGHCDCSVPCSNASAAAYVCCMTELRQEMLKRQGEDYATIAEPGTTGYQELELSRRWKWCFRSMHTWTRTTIWNLCKKSAITTADFSLFTDNRCLTPTMSPGLCRPWKRFKTTSILLYFNKTTCPG